MKESVVPTQLLTFQDAARLGKNSPAWWRKLAARRRIATVKLGRSARLREQDVYRVLSEGFRPAQRETQP
jgi:hypothetical protein